MSGSRSYSRDPAECARWRTRLAEQLRFHEFAQYVFETQWQSLRAYCRDKAVMLIGDLPIFVAHDSACVWSNPELFYLDALGRPLVVAGVPPDYFSETGQLWGNPLYRWDVHATDDYSWWVDRIRFLLGRVDLIRIDHFRGFEAYWEIPAGSLTAAPGRWVEGPGRAFFESLRRQLGSLPLIAEDLGVITPAVEAPARPIWPARDARAPVRLRRDPGAETYLPHGFVHHCLAYTGTHDNDTTLGWLTSTEVATTQSPEELQRRAGVRAALPRPAGRRDSLGDDPPGSCIDRGYGDHSDARHPWPRQSRTDEYSRKGRRQLGMAISMGRSSARSSARSSLTSLLSITDGMDRCPPRSILVTARLARQIRRLWRWQKSTRVNERRGCRNTNADSRHALCRRGP